MASIDLRSLATKVESAIDNLIVVNVTDSSHAMARRILEQVDEDGSELRPTVVVAGRQSSGQGRGNRRWSSPDGGLYCNWLCGDINTELVPVLPMVAASAAHQAVASTGVSPLRIKWPNDLLVKGSKIAGVLVHCRQAERALVTVGLGVNIDHAPDLTGENPPHPPTSVLEHVPSIDPVDAAASILRTLIAGLNRGLERPDDAVRSWRRNLLHSQGDAMTVRTASGENVTGVFDGVNADGHVRIVTESGRRTLSSGDIIEP